MQTLASLTKNTDVVVNAVCPGYAKSEWSRGEKGLINDV